MGLVGKSFLVTDDRSELFNSVVVIEHVTDGYVFYTVDEQESGHAKLGIVLMRIERGLWEEL
jgi:hypothetical protein